MSLVAFFLIFLSVCNFFSDGYSNSCVEAPTNCYHTKYRSYDGSCNNIKNPYWGMSATRYGRILPPRYGDGIYTFPTAKSKNPLPGARNVSITLFKDVPVKGEFLSLTAVQYTQAITQDMSLTYLEHNLDCCPKDSAPLPPKCQPILISDNDPDYSKAHIKCLPFSRTVTDKDKNCAEENQPAEQLSKTNHYLDLSTIYGNSETANKRLRENKGGRLRVDDIDGQQWPYGLRNLSLQCVFANKPNDCYYANERQDHQNFLLTVTFVILLTEHNRIATILAKLNPHWEDETIFQEARKINIAQYQHITYYELLPIILGRNHLLKNKVLYETDGFVNDYDEKVDPSVLNEYATAAMRFYHAELAGDLHSIAEGRHTYKILRLKEWHLQPEIISDDAYFDAVARGSIPHPKTAHDQCPYKEKTKTFLFKSGWLGVDLKALDVQRDRDHGLPSYNDVREYCHLPRANKFDELQFQNHRKELKNLYESPNDIELTVGGALEEPLSGTLLGPTFHCIVMKQFLISRTADRFWFENWYETGFTLEQLKEIRKASISRLLCDNGRHIVHMQPRGFLEVSKYNPLQLCDSLPKVNLSLWREETSIPER